MYTRVADPAGVYPDPNVEQEPDQDLQPCLLAFSVVFVFKSISVFFIALKSLSEWQKKRIDGLSVAKVPLK